MLDRLCDDVHRVLAPGGHLLLTQSVLADADRTVERVSAAGLQARVVARAPEPFGPVMRRRADLLRARGLLSPGQDHEGLVVICAELPAAAEVRRVA